MYRVAPSAAAPGSASGGRMLSASASRVRRSWDVKNRPRAAAHVRSTRVHGAAAITAAAPSAFRNWRRLSRIATAWTGVGGGGAAGGESRDRFGRRRRLTGGSYRDGARSVKERCV